ncbi:MAG: FAD-binding oxidoreductase [Demequinaceae bacterium]|nr:FAD-binding oxidoreductase [Demequinaceae bacterium]
MTAPPPPVADWVAALKEAIDGEVDSSTRRRAEYSTDASNYRVVPEVVAFPRNADDLVAALKAAREVGAPVTMRAGGTSIAGNSIGPGIVLDTSRHMTKILSIDPEKRAARVQPGTILGHLQREAAKHGLRFGPDPSTITRACFGGTIANNACGPRALVWGKAADNVLSLDVVDGKGNRFIAEDDLSVVPGLEEWVKEHLALIRREFGKTTRQVAGYSLEHLLPENGHHLGRFFGGTEGTLASIVEAEVRLVKPPKHLLMGAFGYDDMPTAADAVVPMLAYKPQAIEGFDASLADRVRAVKGSGSIPELPAGASFLFVETGGDTPEEAAQAMRGIAKDSGALAHRIVPDPKEAARLWAIRADGAGLAGRTEENVEAWPGWEDAAIPPRNLGNYLRDLDGLFDRFGISGQKYGHFGEGCVHMRLDFPLRDNVPAFRDFMEEAADLAIKHEGTITGEHGDGRARSELLARQYSPAAIQAFSEIKHFFDPHNLMNPGVIVDPRPFDADLRRPHAPVVERSTGFAFLHDHGDISEAVHRCTGVGKCRADSIEQGTGFMCPSYAATKDEKDSTRGRARVLQDAVNGTLVKGLTSPEVLEALDLCLSCKACSSDCPSAVDMAAYRAEVLHRKYKGRIRPIMHYSLGWLPRWLRLVGLAPWAANLLMKPRWIERIVVKLAGLDTRRHMPRFATKPFRRSAAVRARRTSDSTPGPRRVLLWADSFSDGMAPEIPHAILAVLEDAGFEVIIAEGQACCGITWISTGQLDGARKRLSHLLTVLGPFAVNGIPIVGVEPSCTATLRSDLVELLPDDPRARAVARSTFTLAEILTGRAPVAPRPDWKPPTLDDVTAVVQPHCHHYSVIGFEADRELLAKAGATVTEASGCCGMAGMWGTTQDHYDTSVAVANNSLLPALKDAPKGSVYLADGYSCRTQADDLANVSGLHLAQLLATRIEDRNRAAGQASGKAASK